MNLAWEQWSESGLKEERLRWQELAREYFRNCELHGEVLPLPPETTDKLLLVADEERPSLCPLERRFEPWAQLFWEQAPASWGQWWGLPGAQPELGLSRALEETGVDLTGASLRLGVGRGHLLEILVGIPLCAGHRDPALQLAVEIYCEFALGTQALDDWVGDISFMRLSQKSSLHVLGQAMNRAPLYGISELSSLFRRALSGLDASRIEVRSLEQSEAWTALELSPCEEGFQAERLSAYTCLPELYKAAFEGLPISSCRFFRSRHLALSLALEKSPGSARLSQRQMLEELLPVPGSDELQVLGTGFGTDWDYLDLAILPDQAVFERLWSKLQSLKIQVRLHFFDSRYRDEVLSVPGA